jgi:hypothetical protein
MKVTIQITLRRTCKTCYKEVCCNKRNYKEIPLGLSSGKEYEITKLKEPSPKLAKEEIGLMNDLFGKSSTITLDGSYSSKIEKLWATLLTI